MQTKKIICWWSGGVTSAVACYLAIQLYGIENCRIIFIDTFNEHPDTYRFKKDCERWYGIEIESITGIGGKYKKIQDVWFAYLSLNVATGAICSTHLKRLVREKWALSMKINNPHTKPIFPLLFHALTKKKCILELQMNFITIPLMYFLGFNNNNCFGTGCVQGGIGYWQKMFKEFRYKFLRMAVIERQLSDLCGEPVTINKDQGKEAKLKEEKERLVFLLPNPKFPKNKSIFDFKDMPIKSLVECNGFCGTNDKILAKV